jgi:hypothetical protein
LAHGEVIRVFLDIDPSSTASLADWSWQVEPVHGLALVSTEIANGQLIATLQVDQDQGLNLTGKVLDVSITATPDRVPEGGETLLFDINDERPAEFVENGQIIGQTWEDKDDYLITIQDESVQGGPPQGMASLEAPATESFETASPAAVSDLASGFLDAVTNGNGPPLAMDSGPGAWAHHLDQMVAHFLESNSLDAEQFAVVQQGVLNQLADQLDGDGLTIGRDGDGNADYPDVLAALGSHGSDQADDAQAGGSASSGAGASDQDVFAHGLAQAGGHGGPGAGSSWELDQGSGGVGQDFSGEYGFGPGAGAGEDPGGAGSGAVGGSS